MSEPALLLPRPPGFAGLLTQPLLAAANRLTGLSRLNGLYQQARRAVAEGDFLDTALATLGVRCDLDPQRLAQVPDTGPLVVVANHPFGGVEGMALAQALRQRRPDLRILANSPAGPGAGTRSADDPCRSVRRRSGGAPEPRTAAPGAGLARRVAVRCWCFRPGRCRIGTCARGP